jgi:hypothetical protein
MMKLIAAAGLALAVAGAALAPAMAGDQDFNLKNRTGATIKRVFISPSRSSHWGDDVLGRDTLGAGENVRIHFSHDARACHYDLRVKFEDGASAEWSDFNLCKITKITLKYEHHQPTAEYE